LLTRDQLLHKNHGLFHVGTYAVFSSMNRFPVSHVGRASIVYSQKRVWVLSGHWSSEVVRGWDKEPVAWESCRQGTEKKLENVHSFEWWRLNLSWGIPFRVVERSKKFASASRGPTRDFSRVRSFTSPPESMYHGIT
jgi:hypothetical protein